ncbi:hypothetical protein [Streptacidiphilus carbonis]|jgi:hypothetical protein|uniref:hypothetical protein n=1 Tax=Streptacidiphilus carbonis TaxID=105422 RepID=UPI001F39D636|nr:hypothetical protein [Streptacidiphilus carbonis]
MSYFRGMGYFQQLPTLSVARSAASTEWSGLYLAVRDSLSRERLAALRMTFAATAAVLGFQLLQHTAGGAALVERIGVVRAELPLWESLARTPLSLFVPAPDLPVWGAALQVFVVFGIAELTLGRRSTLLIAYAGTLAGTLYARHGVQQGPAALFGLPWEDAWVRDTGPSAAVVALAVAVAWRHHAWVTGGVTVVALVLEQVLYPNLAGAEHLAAIFLVTVSALCLAALERGCRSAVVYGAVPRAPR